MSSREGERERERERDRDRERERETEKERERERLLRSLSILPKKNANNPERSGERERPETLQLICSSKYFHLSLHHAVVTSIILADETIVRRLSSPTNLQFCVITKYTL